MIACNLLKTEQVQPIIQIPERLMSLLAIAERRSHHSRSKVKVPGPFKRQAALAKVTFVLQRIETDSHLNQGILKDAR